MRVLVCGGRDYQDRQHVFSTLDDIDFAFDVRLVVHGACCDRDGVLRGADRWANEWALSREIQVLGVPAEWSLFGRKAGPVRNAHMLVRYAPDIVVAFPGGTGTADMVSKASNAVLPNGGRVRVIEVGRG